MMRPSEQQELADSSTAGQPTRDDYKRLVESFAQALWETDAAGRVVDDSPTWRAYTGQTREQWLGEGWVSAVHPDDRAYALDQWQQAIKAQTPINAEFRLQSPDGNWRWTNVRITAILGPDGAVHKWVGLTVDITDRKRAEEALGQSEERFRAFVTATSDAVYRMSADWRQMHQLVGKSFLLDTSTSNTSWLEQYIPPQDRDQVRSVIDRTIETKKPFELTHRVIQADGALGWTSSRAVPILNPQGEIMEWFGTASDITDHKRAEDAQRQSEAQYRTLFNSIDEGFCTIEVLVDETGKAVDYRFLETNPAFIRQTGFENAIGKTMRELTPEHESFWFDIYGHIAKFDQAVRFEHEANKLGRIYDVYAFPIESFAKNRVAILFNDITERKRREANLAFLAEVSQDLVKLTHIDDTMDRLSTKIGRHTNLSRCAFAEIDDDHLTGRITHDWHQPGLPDIVGFYQLSDFVGEELGQAARAGDLFIIRDTATDGRVDAKKQASVNVGSFVHVPIIQDGKWRFSLAIYHTTPYDWRDDEIELIRELTTRIWTRLERARAEEALQESERFTRGIIRSLPLAIYLFDLVKRQNRYLSPQVVDLFGYTAEQIRANTIDPFSTFFHPDDQPSLNAYFERIRTSQEGAEGRPDVFQIEYRVNHRERGWIWVESRDIVYDHDAEGKPMLLLGTAEDITERRQTNEALRIADQRKDEFLALLAHELRNPMATVRNGLNILSLLDGTNEVASQTVRMMNRQVDHLVRLVDDLLDVSRISQHKVQLKHERVELGALVAGVVEAIRPQYATHRKQLHITPAPLPLFVDGDTTRLTQVVGNLLTNGLRYTGELGQVWVRLEKEAEEAVLRVADNGIGLTADQRTTIFELFVQADTSLARSQGGLGIGLTLIKRLAEMHGGRVEAHSPGLGKGSEFVLYLPLLEKLTNEPNQMSATTASPTTHPRILAIDDNADAVLTLSMMLKLKGYEVHSRLSGREGIQAAETLHPAIILCDIGMPEMDGYETCRRIRQHPWGQAIRLIALTGYGQADDKQRAQEAGFDGHLVKPVNADELMRLFTTLPVPDKTNH